MKKRTLIIILGIWIAIVPILGLPNVWKNRVVSVSALVVVWLAYSRKSSALASVASAKISANTPVTKSTSTAPTNSAN